ncbi:MAG: peptide chain release factor-like protein [Nitrospirota bacterium]
MPGRRRPRTGAGGKDDPLAAETRVTFFRSGGPGGQHRNKTETAVRLRHLPTGLTVVAAEERSQRRNRAIAFERLRQKLRALRTPRAARIPTAAPAAFTETRLRVKRLHAAKKAERRRVEED